MIYDIKFQKLEETDLPVVKEIYDYYIAHSTATFHTEPISIAELKEFIHVNNSQYPSFMILSDGVTAGYCYFTYFKKRQAYDRSAEVTLYLKPEFCGHGIGKRVLKYLENIAKEKGIKNLLGIITGNNTESIKLFEKMGYFKCAHFKNIGEKMGLILDVVAYQKEI